MRSEKKNHAPAPVAGVFLRTGPLNLHESKTVTFHEGEPC